MFVQKNMFFLERNLSGFFSELLAKIISRSVKILELQDDAMSFFRGIFGHPVFNDPTMIWAYFLMSVAPGS